MTELPMILKIEDVGQKLSAYVNWNKRKSLHNKKIQFPQD